MTTFTVASYEDIRARSRYLGQGQVITSYSICGMLLLVPGLDTCVWHTSSHISSDIRTMPWAYLTLAMLGCSSSAKLHRVHRTKQKGFCCHHHMSWLLKSPVTRMFVQQFFRVTTKITTNFRITGSLQENLTGTGGFLHKTTVMRKQLPCHDTIMIYGEFHIPSNLKCKGAPNPKT